MHSQVLETKVRSIYVYGFRKIIFLPLLHTFSLSMKYTCEIIIQKPRQEVITHFDSIENLYKWMEGLEKFEVLSGDAGEVGAQSRLTFQLGKRKLEMVETITEKNLPDTFSGNYVANGVVNHIKNEFIDQGESTLYRTYQEFELSGVMKLFGWFFPSMFKKQSMKHLEAFKKFAESN